MRDALTASPVVASELQQCSRQQGRERRLLHQVNVDPVRSSLPSNWTPPPGREGVGRGADQRRCAILRIVGAFDKVQARLGEALAANTAGSGVEHVVIALPSFSVGESLLSHYVDRIPGLEHRYLLAILMLHRIDRCEFVFVSCSAPHPEVVDYYLSLLPEEQREQAQRRLHILEVPDRTGRAVAAKLLDRPDLIEHLRSLIGERPAVIEPWNVQADEVALAERLDVPINGTSPALWELGFKSAGRRIFREASVPTPAGREGVRTVNEIVDAVNDIKRTHPSVTGVVVKLDDSGAGDGNVVVDLREPDALARSLAVLPDWYITDLSAGGVVEQMITGARVTSPSVQVDMLPDGSARVLATHEQVLGGATGQVYMGCRFPADPEYAPRLADYGHTVGKLLAERGARGRAGIDFMAARRADGTWDLYALEINLRKGGTTHPYAVLRNLVPGRYDAASGQWISDRDGSPRAYWSTDNLVDPAWLGLTPRAVIDAVSMAGLEFDVERGVGVVLHMLSGLAIDGRLGMTAIGYDDQHAGELYEAAAASIARAAQRG